MRAAGPARPSVGTQATPPFVVDTLTETGSAAVPAVRTLGPAGIARGLLLRTPNNLRHALASIGCSPPTARSGPPAAAGITLPGLMPPPIGGPCAYSGPSPSRWATPDPARCGSATWSGTPG